MSIAQPLLGVFPGEVEGDPLVDVVAGVDVDGVVDVVDVSAVFLVSPPAVSVDVDVDVDVPLEPPSVLDASLFDAVPLFDAARLSVL
jgi:hypothetical protein